MSKKKRVQAPIVDVKNKTKLAPQATEIKKQTSNGVTFITQEKIVLEPKKGKEELKKPDERKVFRTTDPKPNASG